MSPARLRSLPLSLGATRSQLWGRVVSLRIDVELLQLAGNDPQLLRQRAMEFLQASLALRAECARVLQ